MHRSAYWSAVDYLKQACDPSYEEAYYNPGVLLRLSDRSSEAQIHLRKALELDLVFAAARRELGFVLALMKRQAVELAPDDAWAHIYLGAYLRGPDAEAAEAEFRIAEKLRPEWSAATLVAGQDL